MFETYLKQLLDKLAETDSQFAADYKRTDKSVSECVGLITQALRKGCNHRDSAVGGSDDLLVGWAVHYYHEDNVTADSFDISEVKFTAIDPPRPKTEVTKSATKSVTKSTTKSKPKPKTVAKDDEFEEFDLDDAAPSSDSETVTTEDEFEEYEL